MLTRHPLRWLALAVTVSAALQWISASYALGFALTLITGGRLGDRHGRKRLFVLGMATFTIASLAAGLASHVGVLIAARVVQGVGSGLMVPQVLSFIHAEFDDDERPRAMTLFAVTFPVGGMAGPLLGGLLTEADLFGWGWRAIFLVNLPIGVLAVTGAALTMPTRPSTAKQRLDLGGLGLLTVGLFAIFYPLTQGRELGWPWWSGFTPVAAALTFLPAAVGSLTSIAALVAWQGDELTTWALIISVVGMGLGMGAVLNALFSSSMAQVTP